MNTFGITYDGKYVPPIKESEDDPFYHFIARTEFGLVEIRIRNRN